MKKHRKVKNGHPRKEVTNMWIIVALIAIVIIVSVIVAVVSSVASAVAASEDEEE